MFQWVEDMLLSIGGLPLSEGGEEWLIDASVYTEEEITYI